MSHTRGFENETLIFEVDNGDELVRVRYLAIASCLRYMLGNTPV
jgi:hypothetical protein